MPSRDEAVATIVPFSAQHNDGPSRKAGKSRSNELRDAFARVFHEGQAGDAESFRREAVHFSHLGSGKDFHRWRLIEIRALPLMSSLLTPSGQLRP
jgi:hypothetical protein